MTLVWRPGYGGAAVSDPDAMAYLRAVEEADNQPLEQGVQQAVNQFVIGCKSDGIWNAIKASCILAGARTLAGALVPLAGTAPTNFNFVAGDYNRETGLVGDGSTKYLDSNRNNDDDPQDNQHIALYSSAFDNVSANFPVVSSDNPGSVNGMSLLSSLNARSRTSTNTLYTATKPFMGMSRSTSSEFRVRYNQSTVTSSVASAAPTVSAVTIFRFRTTSDVESFSSSRLAFYSIGESLDLAALDTRVSALITAIGAAIP